MVNGKSGFADCFDNQADMHRHVDAGMGIATGLPKAFAQMGIVIDPTLQLAVGHLGIEGREVALGQLGAAIGTDGEMFHKAFAVFVRYGHKDTENQRDNHACQLQ